MSPRHTHEITDTEGRLAQLGERCVRNAEVGSSSLLPSTTFLQQFTNFCSGCCIRGFSVCLFVPRTSARRSSLIHAFKIAVRQLSDRYNRRPQACVECQPMTLAYASLVMIWATFVLEIRNLRRAVPPVPRRTSLAFSLIAGMTVGVLLSVLGI